VSDVTTTQIESDPNSRRESGPEDVLVLTIAWSAEEPHRVGEVAIFPEDRRTRTLGRGDEEADVGFFRQRPGTIDMTPSLMGAGLSRRQLLLTPGNGVLVVEQAGRCELRVNGAVCQRALVAAGHTIQLKRQLVLLCTRRLPLIPALRHFPRASLPAFGEPDPFGILGESPATWLLRERLAFAAKSGTHVLIAGESGTGKELAARAIHGLSKRASKPFVARNAATLPAGLIDAELFGNVKNYPNPGMPERPGLIGLADGGTLFLDEIGELPAELQTHLLRVLDAGGEYQRLGEGTTRRSSFCLVGATNRDPESLKHDLLARLTARVELTPLSARREDVPLLARHLLLRAAEKSPEVASRFLAPGPEGRVYPRMKASLVEHVLLRDFATNTRELDALLWRAMAESPEDTLIVPESELAPKRASSTQLAAAPGAKDEAIVEEPSLEAIRAALAAAKGSVSRAAKALGLSSRYALYRLMKKHGVEGAEET
jgi:two-component system nitrogen regulation response regulator GlnG/two-component system response regulator HydG